MRTQTFRVVTRLLVERGHSEAESHWALGLAEQQGARTARDAYERAVGLLAAALAGGTDLGAADD